MSAEQDNLTQNLPAGVVLAATPLGNVADASPRLAQALATADVRAELGAIKASTLAIAGTDDPAAEGAADAAVEPDEQWTLTLACDMPRAADAARALIAEIEARGTSRAASPASEATDSDRTGTAPGQAGHQRRRRHRPQRSRCQPAPGREVRRAGQEQGWQALAR